jgi:hypothetical protein
MALERALSQNLLLKRQVALQASVEARTLITLSPEKPVVSFYIEDMLNSPTENQIVRRWQISQGFEFPLTTYFRANAQSKLATAAANETKEVESEIAARTRKAYARAVMAQAMKTLAEENTCHLTTIFRDFKTACRNRRSLTVASLASED